VGIVHEECVSLSVPGTRLQVTNLPSRVSNLAEMAAIGLGLPAETFKDAGRYG
jgi:hypothetical protein